MFGVFKVVIWFFVEFYINCMWKKWKMKFESLNFISIVFVYLRILSVVILVVFDFEYWVENMNVFKFSVVDLEN